MPIYTIARGIVDELGKRPYLLEVDEVLLENQPVLKKSSYEVCSISCVYLFYDAWNGR